MAMTHKAGQADFESHDAGFLTRMGEAVSEVIGAVANAHRTADRYDALSHVGPEELTQMGLSREDVPRAPAHRD